MKEELTRAYRRGAEVLLIQNYSMRLEVSCDSSGFGR
jgi:hypothetical protein